MNAIMIKLTEVQILEQAVDNQPSFFTLKLIGSMRANDDMRFKAFVSLAKNELGAVMTWTTQPDVEAFVNDMKTKAYNVTLDGRVTILDPQPLAEPTIVTTISMLS